MDMSTGDYTFRNPVSEREVIYAVVCASPTAAQMSRDGTEEN